MMYSIILFLVFLVFTNARLGEKNDCPSITPTFRLRGQHPLPESNRSDDVPKSAPLKNPVHELGVFKKNPMLNLRKLFQQYSECIEEYGKTQVPSDKSTSNDYFGHLVEYWMNPGDSFQDVADWLCNDSNTNI